MKKHAIDPSRLPEAAYSSSQNLLTQQFSQLTITQDFDTSNDPVLSQEAISDEHELTERIRALFEENSFESFESFEEPLEIICRLRKKLTIKKQKLKEAQQNVEELKKENLFLKSSKYRLEKIEAHEKFRRCFSLSDSDI